MKGPKLSVLGYKIPLKESVKPLQRQKALVKVYSYQAFTHFSNQVKLHMLSFQFLFIESMSSSIHRCR